ncbi:MAG: hypothetical protein ACRCS8_01675 [Brevinema sp.]
MTKELKKIMDLLNSIDASKLKDLSQKYNNDHETMINDILKKGLKEVYKNFQTKKIHLGILSQNEQLFLYSLSNQKFSSSVKSTVLYIMQSFLAYEKEEFVNIEPLMGLEIVEYETLTNPLFIRISQQDQYQLLDEFEHSCEEKLLSRAKGFALAVRTIEKLRIK